MQKLVLALSYFLVIYRILGPKERKDLSVAFSCSGPPSPPTARLECSAVCFPKNFKGNAFELDSPTPAYKLPGPHFLSDKLVLFKGTAHLDPLLSAGFGA